MFLTSPIRYTNGQVAHEKVLSLLIREMQIKMKLGFSSHCYHKGKRMKRLSGLSTGKHADVKKRIVQLTLIVSYIQNTQHPMTHQFHS